MATQEDATGERMWQDAERRGPDWMSDMRAREARERASLAAQDFRTRMHGSISIALARMGILDVDIEVLGPDSFSFGLPRTSPLAGDVEDLTLGELEMVARAFGTRAIRIDIDDPGPEGDDPKGPHLVVSVRGIDLTLPWSHWVEADDGEA